jgi:hypothetical protein
VDFWGAHTVSNDAAYTITAALQMIMKANLPQIAERSLQDVVDDLKVISKETNPGWGIVYGGAHWERLSLTTLMKTMP